MKKNNLSLIYVCLYTSIIVLISTSCRKEPPFKEPVSIKTKTGFFLLNEGAMGSNKASLDFYNYEDGVYMKNIFPSTNPEVGFKLGDVGNDLQIYGSKLYAVINCSNMVEVMDKNSAKHIGNFTIPNCRYIVFANGKAYVSSYAGAKYNGEKQLGFVAEIDTTTLKETRRVAVGYQPEEMQVIDNKLYVANSGGYTPTDYDKTISIIDLTTLKEIKKLEVAINLFRIKKDNSNNLYISSRGNYGTIKSNIYKFDPKTEALEALDIENNSFVISGDSLYCISYDYITQKKVFCIYNIKTKALVSGNFISDGSGDNIILPYNIAYNRGRKEIYITDAKDFTIPGEVFCYSIDGKNKWKQTTGDIPSSIVFLNEK